MHDNFRALAARPSHFAHHVETRTRSLAKNIQQRSLNEMSIGGLECGMQGRGLECSSTSSHFSQLLLSISITENIFSGPYISPLR